ncbi:acetyl-CoA synthetase-like protein [Backusella circina FSU 941]|nr:acetyl-CoA synthetase-like protein [Backusella circina FSU 941]
MLSETNQDPESSPTSIFDLIFVKNPNKIPANAPVYIADPKVITFGELEYLIRKCAYNLKEKYNIQKGDVVAMRTSSHVYRPAIAHAIIFAGGTVAFLRNTKEDVVEGIAEDLKTVEPKLFITEYGTREVSLKAAAKAGILASQILMLSSISDEEEAKEMKEVKEAIWVKNTLLSGDNLLSTHYPFTENELENHPAFIFFTSGTTGNPKAVMGTSKAAIVHLKRFYPTSKIASRVISFGPSYGTGVLFPDLLTHLILGNQLHFCYGATLDKFCQFVEKYAINGFTTLPFMIGNMLKNAEYIKKNYDLSSLKRITTTGNMIPVSVIAAAKETFGVSMINMYGGTETRGPFYTSPKLTAMGAMGMLKQEYQARLVDQNEQDVGVDQPGELLVKGVCVTKGYYNNAEANADSFTKDGYYRTGDIVKRDKEGVFWYLSRCKDLIRYQRERVYPYDIEKVVLTHPKVDDCGVIGVYSQELLTDLPRAYITLTHEEDYENKEDIAKEVLEYANKQLSEKKQIRAGVFVKDTLKRTATGKIIYLSLKEEALDEKIN